MATFHGNRASILILAALLAACTGGDEVDSPGLETRTGEAAAAADSMRSALQYAFVDRDAAAVAMLFAEDAIVIEPDGTLRVGRSAIQARIAQLLPRLDGYTIASHGFVAGDDLASDRQTYQVRMVPSAAGEAATMEGHQLVVIGRQGDGSWKILHSGSWISPSAASDAHH